MKKRMLIAAIGCLFLMTGCVQAQMDRGVDRYQHRGEPRMQPGDLRVLDLEISPDPIREGQRVRFRVTITNNSDHSGRISLTIKDRDRSLNS